VVFFTFEEGGKCHHLRQKPPPPPPSPIASSFFSFFFFSREAKCLSHSFSPQTKKGKKQHKHQKKQTTTATTTKESAVTVVSTLRLVSLSTFFRDLFSRGQRAFLLPPEKIQNNNRRRRRKRPLFLSAISPQVFPLRCIFSSVCPLRLRFVHLFYARREGERGK
jgi:hypothetical protein